MPCARSATTTSASRCSLETIANLPFLPFLPLFLLLLLLEVDGSRIVWIDGENHVGQAVGFAVERDPHFVVQLFGRFAADLEFHLVPGEEPLERRLQFRRIFRFHL